eukprot:14392964-Alexandrium_andersonii.AAC.1
MLTERNAQACARPRRPCVRRAGLCNVRQACLRFASALLAATFTAWRGRLPRPQERAPPDKHTR